jgi:1-acyl-sn-glycerol-3-phosphate acyltransferase
MVWRLRSVLISAPAIILLTAVMGCIASVCSIWDRTGVINHWLARKWSRMLLACGFVRWDATGVEKLDPGGTYVLVANHASFLDIPVILSAVPVEVRFFAKKSLFSLPFIGWYLKRGHLEVERGDARASLKSMLEGARVIKERRISVLLFPEGGRSPDGMRPFIEGAAYIAIKAGVPVVPIGLRNTGGVLPMHSLLLRPGRIEIHVGDPVETAGMTPRDRGQLNETLYRQVAELAGEAVPSAV